MLGALGAHLLKKILDPERLAIWHTAVEYHFYSTLGLLLLALGSAQMSHREKLLNRAMQCLLAGMLMFSGSIYLLAFCKFPGWEFLSFLGPITPLGGVLMIVGWMIAGLSFVRKK
jgi:uncharacterized membrane protein YgdD (TMEM256/DUF423 family)